MEEGKKSLSVLREDSEHSLVQNKFLITPQFHHRHSAFPMFGPVGLQGRKSCLQETSYFSGKWMQFPSCPATIPSVTSITNWT